MSNLMNKWGFLVPTILVIVMFVLGWVEGKRQADKWWQARTDQACSRCEEMMAAKDKLIAEQKRIMGRAEETLTKCGSELTVWEKRNAQTLSSLAYAVRGQREALEAIEKQKNYRK